MAAIDTTRTAAGLPAGRLFSVFTSMFSRIAAWNDARTTRNALSKLTARELDDIGLCRGDIDDVASSIRR